MYFCTEQLIRSFKSCLQLGFKGIEISAIALYHDPIESIKIVLRLYDVHNNKKLTRA